MGGVDRSNQMINTYSFLQKTQKWWKSLFFHFVDIAFVNSFWLFQDWQCTTTGHAVQRQGIKAFREHLVMTLLSSSYSFSVLVVSRDSCSFTSHKNAIGQNYWTESYC